MQENGTVTAPAAPEWIPPHDVDAERAALGCALRGVTGLDHVLAGLTAASYYLSPHGAVHGGLLALRERQVERIDPLVLGSYLQDQGLLDTCGGKSYLAALVDAVQNPDHVESYVAIVREKKLLRDLMELPKFITDTVGSGEPAEVCRDRIEKAIFALGSTRTLDRVKSAQELDATFRVRLIDLLEQAELPPAERQVPGVPTGFRSLDYILERLQPGTCTIIAGDTSMGKSSLAAQIAVNAAERGYPAALATNEMLPDQVYLRQVARVASTGLKDLNHPETLEPGVLSRVIEASSQLGSIPLSVIQAAGCTMLDIRSEARRLHGLGLCRLLVVDYLQKVRPHTRNASREGDVSAMSAALNDLSKELEIPVIGVAQLKRRQKGGDKRPNLNDLRESGAIENDADAVVLLYREHYFTAERQEIREDADPVDQDEDAEAIIAKNRHWRKGTVRLTFRGKTTSFHEQDLEHADEAPPPSEEYVPDWAEPEGEYEFPDGEGSGGGSVPYSPI